MYPSDLLNELLEQATQMGAQDAAVSYSHTQHTQVDLRNGETEKILGGTEQSVGLQVFKDSRSGYFSTNKLNNKSDVSDFVRKAIDACMLIEPDPYQVLPDSALYPKGSNSKLDIYDKAKLRMPTQDLVQAALQVYRATQQEALPFVSVQTGASCAFSTSVRLNTKGLHAAYQSSSFSLVGEVSLSQKGDKRAEAYSAGRSRFWQTLPTATQIGEDACLRAAEKLGEAKAASGTYQMLIENRVSSRLVSVLLQALSASLLATGRTFLADKLGLQVVSPLLSLVDNPCVLQGLGSRPFDSEGVALRRRDLFRDGKPVQWLADSYYAAKLGIPHTSTSTGNILFECETQPLESLLKVSSPTIWVKSFNGGNSNQLTGDFSYGISGLLLRPNEAPQAVSEMVLSGNILELFSRLVAVANDPNPNASMRSPSLLFDSVSFSGK